MVDEQGDTHIANTLLATEKDDDQVGPYRLQARLGSGGMGEVWGAVDSRDGKRVAIKLSSAIGETSHARRFSREVELLAGFDHPAIVPYIQHGITPDGRFFLVMEWLEGEDLSNRLQRGPLPIDEVTTLGRRICSALCVAHAHGVIHRDLKPGNIFLVGGAVEHAKLIDFGIAREEERSTRLTRTGGLLGTPAYMSPEQARGEHALDARSDLFALGCVLHECISGTPPFTGNQAMAILAKILFDDPPELGKSVPPRIRSLVASLLAKKQTGSSAGVVDGDRLEQRFHEGM